MSNWAAALRDLQNGVGEFFQPDPEMITNCEQLQAVHDRLAESIIIWNDRHKNGNDKEKKNAAKILDILHSRIDEYEAVIDRDCGIEPPVIPAPTDGSADGVNPTEKEIVSADQLTTGAGQGSDTSAAASGATDKNKLLKTAGYVAAGVVILGLMIWVVKKSMVKT